MLRKISLSVVFLNTLGLIKLGSSEPPSTSYGVPFTNNNNFGPTQGPILNNFGGNNNGYGNGGYNGDGNSFGHGHHEGQDHDHSEPKSYEFGYAVKDDYTGNNYKRREQSDGNQVQGEYRVQLPDGRTQIVTYYADWKTGFHADVRYEGEAQYPKIYNTYGNGGNNNGNYGNQGQNNYNTIGNQGGYGQNFGNIQNLSNQYGAPFQNAPNNNNFHGNGATSNVNIKDFSGPGEPYNAGGYHGNDGNHFDSYANNQLTGNRAPNSHYGVPH